MGPSYRSSDVDETPDPRRNLFGNTGNSRFAGETPFRSGNANSSGLFTPTPGGSNSTGRALFDNYKAPENGDRDLEDDEEDEDGEYEVETPITRNAVGSNTFGSTNVVKQGVPQGGEHKYSSSTDGDDEESPDHDEEGEEQSDADNEEIDREDEEYEEGEEGEESEEDETEEEEEYDEESAEIEDEDETMEDDDVQDTSGQQRQNSSHRSFKKPPVSKALFLQNNPSLLIKRSNNVLRSLGNLLAPAEEREDTLPEASPIHCPPAMTAGKKVGYLAKYISIFLSDLQSVASSENDRCIFNAYYLASLLLNIQHPSAQAVGKPNSTPSPIEVFKAFLNTHHPNPSTTELQILHTYHPTPCASPDYWPVLAHLTVRGELTEVESLLGRGGWAHIVERKPETGEGHKYTSDQVELIDHVLRASVKIVTAAPQLFVKGRAEYERFAEWRIYRGRVHAAIEELKSFSQSPSDVDVEENAEWKYETVVTTKNGFTTQVRQHVKVVKPKPMRLRGDEKKGTKCPKDVEQGLMSIYQILAGKIDTILMVSDRWQEAVLGASIWRRYFDEDDLEEDLDMTDSPNGSGFLNRNLRATSTLRANVSRSGLNQRCGARRSKRTYNEIETLKSSFQRVTTKDFPIDSTNLVEKGTANILKGDWKALLDLITSKEDGMAAFTVAEFILEVAKLADWSTMDCEDLVADKDIYVSLLNGFRNEDFNNMLGSMGATSDNDAIRARKIKKWEETVVEGYVRCLVRAGTLEEPRDDEMETDFDDTPKEAVEGWEIGVEILQRWATLTMGEELEWSRKLAGEILSSLPLTSTSQVEKILNHCKSYSLPETYTSIAAAYASHLYAASQLGSSLLYYSRAGNKAKIHFILTRLCSQSLLLSSAYPPEDKLDPTFRELLECPTADEDDILRFELSGYAALRMFYNARDRGENDVAARALIALIRSAGEMVDGGRGIDEEWESPVEWWMSGVFFGEVLCFLNQERRWLAVREMMDVLKVVQDVMGAVKATFGQHGMLTCQAETFLRKCLLAHKNPSDIPRLLKKPTSSSMSSMTSSGMLSSWQKLDEDDDMNENEEEEEEEDGFAIVSGEGLEEVKRGWDWRASMVHILDKEKMRGGVLETVVRIVRMGFAKELARGWLDGEGELGVEAIGETIGQGYGESGAEVEMEGIII